MDFSWKSFLSHALQIAPLVLAETPLAPLAPYVASAAANAQHADQDGNGSLSGAEKLSLARAEIQIGLSSVNAQRASQGLPPILDVDMGTGIFDHAISAVVDATKFVQKKAALANGVIT